MKHHKKGKEDGGKRMGEGRYSKLAIWSFVLGIYYPLAFFFFTFVGPWLSSVIGVVSVVLRITMSIFGISFFIAPILSLIFGIIALVKVKKNRKLKGKILAIVGIIISSLPLVILTIIVLMGAFE